MDERAKFQLLVSTFLRADYKYKISIKEHENLGVFAAEVKGFNALLFEMISSSTNRK